MFLYPFGIRKRVVAELICTTGIFVYCYKILIYRTFNHLYMYIGINGKKVPVYNLFKGEVHNSHIDQAQPMLYSAELGKSPLKILLYR